MTDDELRGELGRLRSRTPAPQAGFTDEVMRQIATHPRPVVSFWQRLNRARTVSFTVRPATLAAAGALVLALGIWLARLPEPAPPMLAQPSPPPAIPAARVHVRFALHAPGASQVAVAGDFNGWRPDATPLERGVDGVWHAVVPLEAGRWSYSFVVDGRWTEDPLAEAWRNDGFGGRNAVVRVGGI